MKRDRRDDDLRRARGRRHRRRRRAESSRRGRREKWFCRRHRAQIYLLLGEGTATDVKKLFCSVFYSKLARFNEIYISRLLENPSLKWFLRQCQHRLSKAKLFQLKV